MQKPSDKKLFYTNAFRLSVGKCHPSLFLWSSCLQISKIFYAFLHFLLNNFVMQQIYRSPEWQQTENDWDYQLIFPFMRACSDFGPLDVFFAVEAIWYSDVSELGNSHITSNTMSIFLLVLLLDSFKIDAWFINYCAAFRQYLTNFQKYQLRHKLTSYLPLERTSSSSTKLQWVRLTTHRIRLIFPPS